MKTIIAPRYLHESIRLDLMKKNNQNYLLGYKFKDIDDLLDLERVDLFDVFETLNKLDLDYFKEMTNYISFLKSVKEISTQFRNYNYDVNNLSEDNIIEKELKKIIINVMKLYKNKIELLDNYENYILYPGFNDLFKERIYQELIDKHAEYYDYKVYKNNIKYLHKSLNPRQEVESIAQLIIDKEYDINDINIICSSSTYYPIIRQVFNRYNLPYNNMEESLTNELSVKFIALFKLGMDFNLDNLIYAIENNAFNIYYDHQSILKYIEIKVSDVDEIMTPFNYYHSLNNEFSKDMIKLEDDALHYQELMLDLLNQLLDYDDIEGLLNNIYLILETFNLKEELQAIRRIVEQDYKKLNDNNIFILLDDINNSTLKEIRNEEGINITSITKPIFPNKITFVIGLDQKNYPNLKVYNGYFDEEYLKKNHFVDKKLRNEQELNSLNWIHVNGETMYYSYSFASLNGKGQELSYYIEQMFDHKALVYDLYQNDNTTYHKPNLSSSEVNDIFIKNNKITSTVYKIEEYFTCPYKAFLSQGLKLKDTYKFDDYNRIIGTINHDFMCQIVKKYNKKYPYVNKNDTNDYYINKLNDLSDIYQNENYLIDIIFKQNINMIKLFLEKILNVEDELVAKPYLEEEKIEETLEFDGTKLMIKGVVDRIDKNDNGGTYILDYKSSQKALNSSRLRSGLDIQLWTYSYCLYKHNPLNLPEGVIYYNFNQASYTVNPMSLNRGKLVLPTNDEILEKYWKENRLRGLLCSMEENGKDKTYDYIANSASYHKAIDFYLMLEDLLTLYVKSLKSGNIKIDPVDGGCAYCDFRHICKFIGKGHKEEPLVDDHGDNPKDKKENSDGE